MSSLAERTPLLEATNEEEPEEVVDTVGIRLLLVQHFSSAWGDRTAEFALYLFLILYYKDTLLPSSILGFSMTLTGIMLSQRAGHLVDRIPKLTVVRYSIIVQKLSALCAYACLATLRLSNDRFSVVSWSIFMLLVSFGCLLQFSNTAISIAVERDWTTCISGGSSIRLGRLNTYLRQTNLFCKLAAPLFVSFLTVRYSSLTPLIVLGFITVVTMFFEIRWISVVYDRFPILEAEQQKKDAQRASNLDSTTEGIEPQDRSILEIVKSTLNTQDWGEFVRLPVFLSSLSISFLYLTVLSFDGTMLGYLKTLDYSDDFLAEMRGLCVITGLVGTVVTVPLESRIGSARAGSWSIWSMVFCLLPVMASFYVFGPTNHLGAFLLFGGMALSRIGLWSFDLIQTKQLQEALTAHRRRNTLMSLQLTMQNIADLLKYILTMFLSRPSQFPYATLVSFCSVLSGAMVYVLYLKKERGHIFHVPHRTSDFDTLEKLIDALPVLDAYFEPGQDDLRSWLMQSMNIERKLKQLQLPKPKLPFFARRWAKLDRKLKDAISSYRRLSSPIQSLPNEILCEIFAHCVAQQKETNNLSFPLLRLIDVCAQWRRVARSSPTLWNHISVVYPHENKANNRSLSPWTSQEPRAKVHRDSDPITPTIRRALQHLRNSGPVVPLSVHWGQDSAVTAKFVKEVHYSLFLDMLLERSARWGSLSVALNIDEFSAFLEKACRPGVDFPNLRVFKARSRVPYGEPWRPFPYDRLIDLFPALTHLRIEAFRESVSLSRDFAPWSRLRHCELTLCQGTEHMDFAPDTRITAVNIHTALSVVEMAECPDPFAAAFLRAVSAPNLTKLRIGPRLGGWLDGISESSSLVLSFIERSSCRLVELGLDIHPSRDNYFWPYLVQLTQSKHMISLIRLDLALAPIVPRLVGLLSSQPESWSQLRTLRVRYWPSAPHKLDDAALFALQASRPKLQTLWLDARFVDFSKTTIPSLRSAGLRIIVARQNGEHFWEL
ncbi:Solute carrier family 40 protein [Mycena indigotica]|uniref:Solute carrier family 40 protein n=1 Tax=Mycena indigotica TaxID=2126181 RepID=A0A8H6T7Z8_9AGAR|nr:Solute carrier family 40 protein [Mycena indigotica]KAF7312600.1 Solute carrier family 40 protein [Mycena indigotica]